MSHFVLYTHIYKKRPKQFQSPSPKTCSNTTSNARRKNQGNGGHTPCVYGKSISYTFMYITYNFCSYL